MMIRRKKKAKKSSECSETEESAADSIEKAEITEEDTGNVGAVEDDNLDEVQAKVHESIAKYFAASFNPSEKSVE